MSTGAILALALGLGLASLLVLGVVLAIVAPPPKSTPKPQAATTATTAAATPTPAVASSAAAAPATTAAPALPVTSAPPAGPKTSFGDGTYEVGSDIAAGKYKATVPQDSTLCYWARLKGLSGSIDDVIASNLHKAGEPVIVTIAKTDAAFNTTGCGTWTKA